MLPSTEVRLHAQRRKQIHATTLLEMLRLYGGRFTLAMYQAGRVQRMLQEGLKGDVEDAKALYQLVHEDIKALPLSYATRKKAERVWERALNDAGIDHSIVADRLEELLLDLTNEMSDDLYLCVPSSDKALWTEPWGWFGWDASNAFPDAQEDIKGCTQCLALEQWTASVYHAMGVFQHGLHWLASELELDFPQDIEVESWGTIIERSQKAIQAMEQGKKTKERDERVALYSDIASHLFHVKAAWRNFVAHGRKRYDEASARRVVENVRGFMHTIATARGGE